MANEEYFIISVDKYDKIHYALSVGDLDSFMFNVDLHRRLSKELLFSIYSISPNQKREILSVADIEQKPRKDVEKTVNSLIDKLKPSEGEK
jgi:hypothetical protein